MQETTPNEEQEINAKLIRFFGVALLITVLAGSTLVWYRFSQRKAAEKKSLKIQMSAIPDYVPESERKPTEIIDNSASSTTYIRPCIEWGSYTNTPDPNKVVKENGDIYYCGLFRGTSKAGLLSIKLSTTTTVRFTGDVSKLSFNPFFELMARSTSGEFASLFTYDGLSFTTHIGASNSGQKNNEPKYDCKNPFITNDPWFYCETSATIESMFQLTEFTDTGFGTGGGSSYYWKKIFAFATKNKSIYAIGTLVEEQEYDTDDMAAIDGSKWERKNSSFEIPQSPQEIEALKKVSKANKKSRLDQLLAEPEVKRKIDSWNMVAATLSIEVK